MSKSKQRVSIAGKLECISGWLDRMDEGLSFGLKSVVDAEKLYDHFANHETMDRYAVEENSDEMSAERIKVLGYDPLA